MDKFHLRREGNEGDSPQTRRICSSGYLRGISAVNSKSREALPSITELYVMKGPLKSPHRALYVLNKEGVTQGVKGHVQVIQLSTTKLDF